ncbi:MAG: FHA domain-containing protein [Planctomycetales bacterium]
MPISSFTADLPRSPLVAHIMPQSLNPYQRNPKSVFGRGESTGAVQITITSGRTRQRVRHIQGSSYFLGSDRHCDLVLEDNRYPPLYALLLVRQQGVILRHLGQGPDLIIDGQPIRREFITADVCIRTGPYTFNLGLNIKTEAQSIRLHPQTDPPQLQQLIQQASRLLSDIGEKPGFHDMTPEIYATKPHRIRSAALSVGLPSQSTSPQTWQHIYQ